MSDPMSTEEAEALLEFCVTGQQRRVLKAIIEHGGISPAGRALGYPENSGAVGNTVSRVRARAALRGYAPEWDYTNPVPPTHLAKGVSTYYDSDGKPTQQWVKSSLDQEVREALIREALEALKDDIPRETKTHAPRNKLPSDLCNMYLITDYHLGMKAWHEETGDDWDLKIAEELLLKWFGLAIHSAPEAEQAVFAQLGDFLHWDGLEAVTPKNKHVLDADTRYQKVVRVAIRVLRQVVRMLLEKHKRVHIVMADANHDPAGSAWLREAFAVFYEDEPRVTVDVSPDTYYAFEWGRTALFFHHGHKRRPTNVADVFAAKFRDLFGRTDHAYGHTGHYHHKVVQETNLMPVEQHRTLAAKDNYASSGGYMAGRDAPVITYSRTHGEVGRLVISPAMAMSA